MPLTYEEGETVLASHGPKLYEAKVRHLVWPVGAAFSHTIGHGPRLFVPCETNLASSSAYSHPCRSKESRPKGDLPPTSFTTMVGTRSSTNGSATIGERSRQEGS
jgi:hypothetical protein